MAIQTAATRRTDFLQAKLTMAILELKPSERGRQRHGKVAATVDEVLLFLSKATVDVTVRQSTKTSDVWQTALTYPAETPGPLGWIGKGSDAFRQNAQTKEL